MEVCSKSLWWANPLCWIVSPFVGRLSEVFVRAGGVLLCCPHTYKFSLHLCSFSSRCLTVLLGPGDLGVVWLSQIAFVTFLLALVHLVLVHGWFVLPGVPLVPGVRPRDAGTLVTFSRSSLGLFLFLVAWCLAVGPSLLVVCCLPGWHPSGFCLPGFLFWVCLPSGLAPPWAVGVWVCFCIFLFCSPLSG